jgi:hypothetical protein
VGSRDINASVACATIRLDRSGQPFDPGAYRIPAITRGSVLSGQNSVGEIEDISSEHIIAGAKAQHRRNMVVALQPEYRRRPAVPPGDSLGKLIGRRRQKARIEFGHREQ